MSFVDGDETNSDFDFQLPEEFDSGTGSEFRRHVTNAVIARQQLLGYFAHFLLSRAKKTRRYVRYLRGETNEERSEY